MMEKDKIEATYPKLVEILPISFKPLFPGIYTSLLISDLPDIKLIENAIINNKYFGALLVNEEDELFRVGTLCKIVKHIKLPDGGYNIFISTIKRFQVQLFLESEDKNKALIAEVKYLEDINDNDESLKAWTKELKDQLSNIKTDNFNEEQKLNIINIDIPAKFADYVASILEAPTNILQNILEELDVKKRIEMILYNIELDKTFKLEQNRIQNLISNKLKKSHVENMLREEMMQIQARLGVANPKTKTLNDLKAKLAALDLEGEAKETVISELQRLYTLDPNVPDYNIGLYYLKTIVALPFEEPKYKDIQISKVKKVLDKDHYGLEDVKDRILELLAVRQLKKESKGSIICLVGPPGVGKTSIGKSIATALGKKYYRFSVGGMKDQNEIKGHRRTYVGALPGKIIQGLKITKTKDPLFLIDEIDKMSSSYQGDPASALLEVLDPEQNREFRDFYLDIPFDISNILFIVTANSLETIPTPLIDRMEIIHLSGYTTKEKLEIGKKYLVPKSLKANGLDKSIVKFPNSILIKIADEYAREAGVRNFEKLLDKINRKIALESLTNEDFKAPLTVTTEIVEKYLGKPRFPNDEVMKANEVGTAIGLAWTSMGGDTLLIEAENIPGDGKHKVTGQLGDVMKESVEISWTVLKRECERRNINREWFKSNDVHIHIPEGATPKDGPSAGITLTCALYSLVTNQVIKQRLAMTGELTLTGLVMPIGGLKEKILAAKRNNINTIIIPKKNKIDLDEIKDYIKDGITFHFVEKIEEVLAIAFENDTNKRISDKEYNKRTKENK